MAGSEYAVRHERRRLADLNPAVYNPRKALKPSDPEFKSIAASITELGYSDPIIINDDGTIIGGHQRTTVLQHLGYTEADVVVVSLNKADEKALNIALNKIGGAWDMEKLKEALEDLSLSPIDFGTIGFTYPEVDVILGKTEQDQEKDPPTIGRMEFTFSLEQFADLQQATKAVAAKYSPDQMETFGNENSLGNRLYMVVKEWAEQRKLI